VPADTSKSMTLARLRILVFPETPKHWTARSLEHDIAAVGSTEEAAVETLIKMFRAHIAYDLRHGREPLSAFGPAPHLYWTVFAAATNVRGARELGWPVSGNPTRCQVAVLAQHPILEWCAHPARIA
jgi:hypothetical protein